MPHFDEALQFLLKFLNHQSLKGAGVGQYIRARRAVRAPINGVVVIFGIKPLFRDAIPLGLACRLTRKAAFIVYANIYNVFYQMRRLVRDDVWSMALQPPFAKFREAQMLRAL